MAVGILSGVGINLVLWLGFKEVFWMWWNLTGCVVAMLVSVGIRFVRAKKIPAGPRGLILWDTDLWKEERRWIPVYCSLIVYFFGLFVLCTLLPMFLEP